MNLKNKTNNKGGLMKYFILSLMIFTSFEAFSGLRRLTLTELVLSDLKTLNTVNNQYVDLNNQFKDLINKKGDLSDYVFQEKRDDLYKKRDDLYAKRTSARVSVNNDLDNLLKYRDASFNKAANEWRQINSALIPPKKRNKRLGPR